MNRRPKIRTRHAPQARTIARRHRAAELAAEADKRARLDCGHYRMLAFQNPDCASCEDFMEQLEKIFEEVLARDDAPA